MGRHVYTSGLLYPRKTVLWDDIWYMGPYICTSGLLYRRKTVLWDQNTFVMMMLINKNYLSRKKIKSLIHQLNNEWLLI